MGNQPILPVRDTYLYPKFSSEGKGKWLRFNPPPISHPLLERKVVVKEPNILEYREFMWNHNGVASRMRNEINICESIRRNPSPYLAEYKGCLVDKWGRVTGIAYERYNTNLLEFAHSGLLRAMHIQFILSDIAEAVGHLKTMEISYGIISPENVYINYICQGEHVFLNQVVLGDFEHAAVGEMPIVKKEEVMVSVKQEAEWLGRVFSADVDDVYEVRTELGLRAEFNSILRMNRWMRERLPL